MLRLFRFALLALTFLILLVLAAAFGLLRASLPVLDGSRVLDGLTAPATIERDADGVPTVTAATRLDLARATGFVHAQDRYFQMDLARRLAGGELAELLGGALTSVDHRNRLHRFRRVAGEIVAHTPPAQRALLDAYVAGVNQGLASLRARPFEYWLLRADPRPWRAEDTVMIVHSMFLRLNDAYATRDAQRGVMSRRLPSTLDDFLNPLGTDWDAPLQGGVPAQPPLPAAADFDLRGRPDAADSLSGVEVDEPVFGSNNWAVSGARTADGRAWVANDMHLGLAVPSTFYRMRMRAGSGVSALDLNGVTIPGAPLLVAGSNGHIAWGLTNSYGDWSDRIELRIDADDPERYFTPEGLRSFETIHETIAVRGGLPVEIEMRLSRWGPVVQDGYSDAPQALRWLAHQPEAVNLTLLELEYSRDVYAAVEVANRIGMPPQNFVVADSAGNIAWTIAGRIPRRRGYDPRRPADWSKPDTGWVGWLAPADYPRVINPESGVIWTANARTVEGIALTRVGQGNYALGARARQIRDRLLELSAAGPADMLAIQLDDRALFLHRWQQLLLELLDDEAIAQAPRREEFRRLVEAWGGRASVDSVGYRLVRAFRSAIQRALYSSLIRDLPAANQVARGWQPSRQFEGPMWRILSQQPLHLLDKQYDSWRDFMLAMADHTQAQLSNPGGLARRSWGERNTARIAHPMSGGLTVLRRWLDMLAEPLSGDTHMPRVQGVSFGASERFAVTPGDEEHGYLHLPAGQSGHPLSPFYAAGHEAWVKGSATPFLPGPSRYTMELIPAASR